MRALRPLAMSAAAILGCGGSTTESSSGAQIRITVSTSGPSQSDKFLVSLDGAQFLSVAPNGSARFERLSAGTYVVHLSSLADNCAVSGTPNHFSVTLDEDEVVQVAFAVVCSAPVSGGFLVTVRTQGAAVDADGYRLSVSTTPMRVIGVNAEELYEGLAPDTYFVTLKGVAWPCKVVGGIPQRFTAVPGTLVPVALTVRCGEEEPPL
jgi:hypothetical protein